MIRPIPTLERTAPLSRWRPARRWRWPLIVLVLSVVIGAALTWLAGADHVDGQPLMLTSVRLFSTIGRTWGRLCALALTVCIEFDVFFDSAGEVAQPQVRFLLFGSDGYRCVDLRRWSRVTARFPGTHSTLPAGATYTPETSCG